MKVHAISCRCQGCAMRCVLDYTLPDDGPFIRPNRCPLGFTCAEWVLAVDCLIEPKVAPVPSYVMRV